MQRFFFKYTIQPFIFFCVLNTSTAAFAESKLEKAVRYATQGDFAIAWCILKPLADSGNPEAEYHLGWMYANGEGLRIDEPKALQLWELASKAGHTEAQFRLAIAYLNGVGTKKDMAKAIYWLKTLYLHGDEDARDILLHLISDNTKEAIELFKGFLQQTPPTIKPTHFIKVKRANMRKGAGKTFSIQKVLEKDSSVFLLESKGNWLHVGVVGTGELGWLYNSLVEKYD